MASPLIRLVPVLPLIRLLRSVIRFPFIIPVIYRGRILIGKVTQKSVAESSHYTKPECETSVRKRCRASDTYQCQWIMMAHANWLFTDIDRFCGREKKAASKI